MNGSLAHILKTKQDDIVETTLRLFRNNTEFLLDYGLKRKGILNQVVITQELRKYLWLKFINKANPLMKGFEKDLDPQFNKQFKEVINNIRANPPGGNPSSDLVKRWMFDEKKWDNIFKETGEPHITKAVITGAEHAVEILEEDNNVRYIRPSNRTEKQDDIDVTDAEILAFIKARSLDYAKQIDDTTKLLIKAQLMAAIEEGESVNQVIKRISEVAEFTSRSRIRMIAQTEMIGAINKGSLEGDRQSGVVWGHQWLGALDDRIRPSHEALTQSGEAVPEGEAFSNGLEYPGDSSGDPAESINCRCSLKPLTEKP